MLTHTVIGPDAEGKFSVAYATPGTTIATLVCGGCSRSEAEAEAERRNRAQIETQLAIRSERRACGLGGIYPDLKKVR